MVTLTFTAKDIQGFSAQRKVQIIIAKGHGINLPIILIIVFVIDTANSIISSKFNYH